MHVCILYVLDISVYYVICKSVKYIIKLYLYISRMCAQFDMLVNVFTNFVEVEKTFGNY